jgi:hypothetical protein
MGRSTDLNPTGEREQQLLLATFIWGMAMILDKSDAVNGYRRSNRITIDHPIDEPPSLTFERQWVIYRDGDRSFNDAGTLTTTMIDKSRPLVVYHPETNQKIMDANDGLFQAFVYSIYLREHGITP